MKLFISYSRDDKNYVYELAQKLRDDGQHDVWIDRRLVGADLWWNTILNEIETCECFVTVLTPKCVSSIYCTAELNYALALNKPILPLVLKSCDSPDTLKAIQFTDISSMSLGDALYRTDKAISRIEVRLIKGEYPLPDHKPSRPPVPEPQANPEHAFEVFSAAEEAAAANDIALAEKLFGQVVKADPNGLGLAAIERLSEIHLERERTTAYINVTRLATNPATLRGAVAAWKVYMRKYGTAYDPNGYATDPRFSNHHPPPVTVTPVQSVGNNGDTLIAHATVGSPFTLPMLEWVPIPAGNVTIEFGDWDQDENRKSVYVAESKHASLVATFQISKYPVTNAQYQAFIDEPDGYRDTQWWDYSEYARRWRDENQQPEKSSFQGDKRPRENVTWYETIAFCRWLSQKTGLPITLPTEQQWQRAAQDDTNWVYPWGDTFDKNKCNTEERGLGKTNDVDRYGKDGKGFSPYGVYDLSGNVWEWCLNEYENIDITDITSDNYRAMRGGSYNYSSGGAQTAARPGPRYKLSPHQRFSNRGFRLALNEKMS